MRKAAAVIAASVMLMACERSGTSSSSSAEGGKPKVVATTTMLADVVGLLGGDSVEVISIMKPGGDPHLYQPTPADAKAVARSQLVITSGLGLEGWIDDLVANAGGTRSVVVTGKGIATIKMAGTEGVDPHFWFDVERWAQATRAAEEGLVALLGPDSEQAAGVRKRAQSYQAQLKALHAWVGAEIDSIPKDKRVLVTSHDAFGYLAAAYNIEVVGIQGISTEQEASQRDVANVVELVQGKGAPAVFVESSVNPALIKQVARETGAKVAGPLFTDSTDAPGKPGGTYIGMIRENTRMIVTELGGKHQTFKPPASEPAP